MSGVTAWQASVLATLGATPGIPLPATRKPTTWTRLGGNAVSSVWSLAAPPLRFFVKVASRAHADMLAAEVEALRALRASGAVRVPSVIARGETQGAAFIVLEWLDLVDGGRGAALGTALARLHATTAPRFGWHRDNALGPTAQQNAWCDAWPEFFRDRRLAPQLALAARNGYGGALQSHGRRLLLAVPALLDDHRPEPSLLHGDLWAGNAAGLDDGTPVVFDPASYYGDRETDIAMTELFGGFTPAFYEAYGDAAPLAPGYPLRRTLYNLYHVLNHLNLFGEAYRDRAESMIEALLAANG